MVEIDQVDKDILRVLQTDARISITDLAKAVGRSKTPIAARLRRMEEAGLITGYRAQIDPLKLNINHVSYVEVRLANTRQAALSDFNKAVRQIPEVEECYMTAGGFDYLLKIRSRDMEHYRTIMSDKVSALPHIASTSTYVAMEAVVEHADIRI